VRFSDHHVTIHEDVLDSFVNRFQHWRSHRDVGYKVTVHDVYSNGLPRVISARRREARIEKKTDPCGPTRRRIVAYDESRFLDRQSLKRGLKER
jgi:hypothetical protein